MNIKDMRIGQTIVAKFNNDFYGKSLKDKILILEKMIRKEKDKKKIEELQTLINDFEYEIKKESRYK